MAYSLLDTSAISPAERFALFSAGLGISHRVARVDGDARLFDARIEVWMMGAMVVSAGRQMALRISRDDEQIRADGFSHVTMMMLREGVGSGEAGGPIAFGVNEVAVLDLTRPMDVSTSDNRNIGVRLPRQLLAEAGLPTAQLHGRVLTGVPGRLLADHFRSLLRHAPTLRGEDAPLVVRATVSLLAIALADPRIADRPTLAAQPGVEPMGVRDRVERYIADRLVRRDLDATSICGEMNLSRSSLYRAFGQGGVASTIRNMRLDAVYRALASEVERRSVAAVAFEHGFTNVAHFNRVFRSRFGCSPGIVRRFVASGLEPAYDAWLKALACVDVT